MPITTVLTAPAPQQVALQQVDPPHVDRAIARIRAYRRAQGWSISRLASEAGMTESVLRRIDERDWNPEAKTLRKLERVVPAEFRQTKVEVKDVAAAAVKQKEASAGDNGKGVAP